MGERKIVLALTLQDAGSQQRAIDRTLHLGVAAQRSAIVADIALGKDDIKKRRLTDDLRRELGGADAFRNAVHERAARRKELLVGAGLPEDLHGREAGRRRDGIARERANLHREVLFADGCLVEVAHDLGLAGDRSQREAAADHLAEGRKIRRHAVVGLRAAIGETEARHDLVEDQHDAVLLSELSEALKEAGLRRDQALEGLDDDRRDLLAMLRDEAFDSRQIVERRHDHLFANGLRNAGRIRHGGGEVREALRREAHEAVVAHTVRAALERQELLAPLVGARDAHRVEIGLRAR